MTETNGHSYAATPVDRAIQLLREGKPSEAAPILTAALDADPANADAHYLLGVTLTQQRDPEAALKCYDRASALAPDNPAIWISRARAERETGRTADALQSCERALALQPSVALVHCLKGDVLSALGRPADAVAAFDKALSLDPRLVDAHNNRGNELRALARPAEALDAYDRTLALDPRHPPALVNRGNALFELGRFNDALAAYEKALPLLPDLALLHIRVGDTLLALDRFADALQSHDRALSLAPGMPQADNGRAMALLWLRRLDEAERAARTAIASQPDYAPAHNTLGNILREAARIDEAIASFRRALDLDSSLADVHFNLGQALLLKGDLGTQSWTAYDQRRRTSRFRLPPLPSPVPEWRGEPLAGQRILVRSEQGLGDTIQFARLLPLLTQQGATVLLEVPPRLARLLRSADLGVEIVTSPPLLGIDRTIPLLSLPLMLSLTAQTIPAPTPYLAPEPERVDQWRSRLGEGFKVGIAWQGNPDGRIDIGRSFSLGSFAPLGAIPGIRVVSLQKGPGTDQIRAAPVGLTVETLDGLDEGPDAFLDTAAVMASLDLIITSDTALAHLAGALGRPVWVALQHVPDWRWQLDRADSPWYPTMRLFRQPTPGNWANVFEAIAAELMTTVAARAQKRPDPLIPASWGEIADKISILEIKSERLTSQAQLANVRRELAALVPILAAIDTPPAALDNLRAELKAINSRLWEIEDAIRAKEAQSAFDDGFIALARSVYTTNDERSRIKRRINDLLGSNLVEEKQYHAYAPQPAKGPR